MPVDIQHARAFLHRRRAQKERARDQRFAQAWQDFRRIVDMLVPRYKPRRIYQWGSLLHREHFWETSDIDIAVEGIGGAEQFFALYGDAERLTRFPLDLVQLERIESEFADLIRLKGIIVYDREQPDPGPHYRG